MRIFHVAQTTPNEIGLPASHLWHVNLYLPLADLGHELIPFAHPWLSEGYNLDLQDAAHRALSERHRPDFSQRLLDAVRAAHEARPIQVFFSYLTSAHVDPEAIREIGRWGITTLNWYCNASFQFHNVAEIAPAFHHCLVPEKFRLEDYRRVGARPIYCQEAANPNVYRPYDLPREFDVTFVGQNYGNRSGCLRRLIDAGIDARAWGPGWQPAPARAWQHVVRRIKHRLVGGPGAVPPDRCGPALSDDELIRMYSRSRISLGFTSVAGQPRDGSPVIKQVRLRDFEATMSGAFYLVEQFDELTEFFEPDREIVFFRDAAELVDKARYYLAHENERERIRRAGAERARREHTWHRRFQTVFDQIGLK